MQEPDYSTCHQKDKMEHLKAICADAPIFTLKPFHKKKAAIITTGNEVYHGRIEDTFTPVIRESWQNMIQSFSWKLLMMIIKDYGWISCGDRGGADAS